MNPYMSNTNGAYFLSFKYMNVMQFKNLFPQICLAFCYFFIWGNQHIINCKINKKHIIHGSIAVNKIFHFCAFLLGSLRMHLNMSASRYTQTLWVTRPKDSMNSYLTITTKLKAWYIFRRDFQEIKQVSHEL